MREVLYFQPKLFMKTISGYDFQLKKESSRGYLNELEEKVAAFLIRDDECEIEKLSLEEIDQIIDNRDSLVEIYKIVEAERNYQKIISRLKSITSCKLKEKRRRLL